jgi:PIN domain nuclease of toxin-antitoxin system
VKLLLDTVTFLHATLDPDALSARARDLILDPGNRRYLSVVSAWEIAVKHALGKIDLAEAPDRFVPKHRERLAAEALPLDEESTLQLTRLPPLHRDPFDRMLVCQAIVHGMVLVTPDRLVAAYPARTVW